jgi:hypothetical protein
MKNKPLILSLAILILLVQPALNLARSGNAEEQTQTTIRILPTQIEKLAIGGSFNLDVSVENCVDIYAVQVDIHYDPAVLEAVDISPGSVYPLPFVIKHESNIFDEELNMTYNGPTYAQVYYVASACEGVPSINGEALLFTVTFKVLSDGSSSIQLIHYPSVQERHGGSSGVGTYFLTSTFDEIYPELYSARYGEPASSPTSSSSGTYDDKGQVLSAVSLPYLLPFAAAAALFLIVVRRRITRKTPNQ